MEVRDLPYYIVLYADGQVVQTSHWRNDEEAKRTARTAILFPPLIVQITRVDLVQGRIAMIPVFED